MYESFYNLTAKPFELLPNPEFLFFSKSHKKALTYLNYGITERAGFILLTGEVGAGKTTILRNIINGLSDKVILARVFNTNVSSLQLLAMINEDFGLDVVRKDKITLLRELNEFLVEQYARGMLPTLIIDEAQNLTPQLLEEVRLLSNLETDQAKLLQIILAGQPELKQTLSRPDLRQFRQRISIVCHLSPLNRAEVEEYIYHRLETAGNRNAVVFQEGAIDAVFRFSRGIPRLTNIICDYLMLSGFAEGTRDLGLELVKEVVGEIEAEHSYWPDLGQHADAPEEQSALSDLAERVTRLEVSCATGSFADTKMMADVANKLKDIQTLLNESLRSSEARFAAQETRIEAMGNRLDRLDSRIADATNAVPDNVKLKKGSW